MGWTATGVAAVGEGVCDAECDGIIVRPAIVHPNSCVITGGAEANILAAVQ